jgi:hypothetical protein
MDLSEMRKQFNDTISFITGEKRHDNKSFMNNEEYDHHMEDVKLSKI